MADDCIGALCYEVSFKTSDLKPDRWQVDGDLGPFGQQRIYPWPGPEEGVANSGFYPAMSAAFDTVGNAEMAKYADSSKSSCNGTCNCIPSTDPKDKTAVQSRVRVTASFKFQDGGTATIFGSFLLETMRINGLCTAGEPVEHVEPPQEGTWYCVDLSERALGAVGGKSAKAAKKK